MNTHIILSEMLRIFLIISFFLILIIHTAKQYLCRDLRTIIMSHQEITDEQSAEFKRVFKRDYNFILTLPLTTLNPFSIYSFSSFVIKRCSPGELAEKKIQTAATTNNMPATTQKINFQPMLVSAKKPDNGIDIIVPKWIPVNIEIIYLREKNAKKMLVQFFLYFTVSENDIIKFIKM